MFVPYIIRNRMKNNIIEKQMKQKLKLKNNKYVYLKLNRRYASLIINSLAFTRRFLYYKKMEEIPVEIFFDKLYEMNLDSRALANLKICVIGSATAKEIKNRGISPDIVPKKFVAEYLFGELKDVLKTTDKVLIPRGKNARDFLVDKISDIYGDIVLNIINKWEISS